MREKTFKEIVEMAEKKDRPKIAFGLQEEEKEILASLKKGKKYADIILVTPKGITKVVGFEVVASENPEEKIATMLAQGEVDGIIRGTIDDFKTYEAYRQITNCKKVINPALMEDTKGREFFLSPGSNPEGWEKEERLFIAEQIAEFAKGLGIKPIIAVFAAERHETYPRKKHIRDGVVGILNKTYEDAEWIVAELVKKGYSAKNWAIDLNPAIEAECNIIVPVNGMVGNQIFRALYVCGSKMLACPRLGLPHCYEDNSRTERDFEFHVKWLVSWINSKKV